MSSNNYAATYSDRSGFFVAIELDRTIISDRAARAARPMSTGEFATLLRALSPSRLARLCVILSRRYADYAEGES